MKTFRLAEFENTISTLNALGYDGEQCVRELERLVYIAKVVITCLEYPRGSEAQVRCLEEVGDDAKAILTKCKAKGDVK